MEMFFLPQVKPTLLSKYSVLSCIEERLDAFFFDLDREQLDEKKAKIRRGLEAIKNASAFDKDGFLRDTHKPMNVDTLRF